MIKAGASQISADKDSTISRPQRWNTPFDEDMGDDQVAHILTLAPFADMDASRFPPALPLDGIIRNDTRRLRFQRGDMVVRAGDYGNSSFLILNGSVGVILPPGLPESMLGHAQTAKRGIGPTISRFFAKSAYPEVRISGGRYITNDVATRGSGVGTQVYLRDIDNVLENYQVATLATGEMFGEVAALARTPRNASVFALEDVELLEIRWQALRDIRRQVNTYRQYIDKLYRERNLITHLREIEVFKYLDDAVMEKIAEHTLFESFGSFDWHTAFKSRAKSGQQRESESAPIALEGDYVDGLLFIRSGFAKITQRINNGHRSLSVLSSGGIFGLEEILHNSRNDNLISYQTGLYALGYSDVLRVPTRIIERFVIPSLPEKVFSDMRNRLQFRVRAEEKSSDHEALDADFLEFTVENRYINGTATMMINLDRCIRCDECVKACADTHHGNPRFVRHGLQHENQMITNACMHCADPVCMIGCPTGAIHRSELGGEVIINDTACIGCASCANACPYDNIRMVEIRGQEGAVVLDSETGTPILKATKCDYCYNLPHGPACENACPHDALVRMNMSDSDALNEWLNK
ncbi:MAG: Fe-S-cluster-containing dehydrogenase component/CRP-like cAMP-binding protein [Gammaproteobacteria bacterium]